MLPTDHSCIFSTYSAQTMYEGRINASSIRLYNHKMEEVPGCISCYSPWCHVGEQFGFKALWMACREVCFYFHSVLCYLLRLASAPVYQCLHDDLPLTFLSFSMFSSCTARPQFLLYLFSLSLFLSSYPSALPLNPRLSVCELLIPLHFFSQHAPVTVKSSAGAHSRLLPCGSIGNCKASACLRWMATGFEARPVLIDMNR